MNIRQSIIDIAFAEVGYKETPKNSNKTKYGKWFNLDGVAWCAIFCSWVYWMAGVPLPKALGFLKGMAGCQSALAYFKKKGCVVKEPKVGDLVFFDWNNDGRVDHVGIFNGWKHKFNGVFWTIEGNTSFTNQSNGGEVMSRERNKNDYTVIFVRPEELNQ